VAEAMGVPTDAVLIESTGVIGRQIKCCMPTSSRPKSWRQACILICVRTHVPSFTMSLRWQENIPDPASALAAAATVWSWTCARDLNPKHGNRCCRLLLLYAALPQLSS
jgi:hypothetical protein